MINVPIRDGRLKKRKRDRATSPILRAAYKTSVCLSIHAIINFAFANSLPLQHTFSRGASTRTYVAAG